MGYYTQGYAADIAILIVGRNASTNSELQKASKTTDGWCRQENPGVNPAKETLVHFMTRRKRDSLKPPTLHDEAVHFSQEATFLVLALTDGR